MPIYEYQCEQCGHRLELLQKMSDAPEVNCPECGKPALIKLISAAGFQLKGSGWYATDFKTKPAAASAPAAEKKPDADNKSSPPDAAAKKADS